MRLRVHYYFVLNTVKAGTSAEGNQKYLNLSCHNFLTAVTDNFK